MQRRYRLRAADVAQRERVISRSGLLLLAALIALVLVLLFPRNTLIQQLRDGRGTDALSISYLSNLLRVEPGNLELRLALAERLLALGQLERLHEVLAPLVDPAPPAPALHDAAHDRAREIRILAWQRRLETIDADGDEARRLRRQLLAALHAELERPLPAALARSYVWLAQQLEDAELARRFQARLPAPAPASALLDQPATFDEALRAAIALGDYDGAVRLHLAALDAAETPEARRRHLEAALRVLRSANRLRDALDLAVRHDGVVGNDPRLLRYLVELALAADRPPAAAAYARRLLEMPQPAPAERAERTERTDGGGAPAARHAAPPLLRRLAPLVEALLPAAQAAEPARDTIAPGLPRRGFDEDDYSLAYQTFLANRDVDDARRVAAEAVRQRPESMLWRERLAQSAEWSGQPAEAALQWRWLVERRPDHRPWHLRLAQTTEWSGQPAEALRLWRWLIENGTAEQSAAGLQAVLRLAPGLNDDEALRDAWRRIALQRPLNDAELQQLADIHLRLADPEAALALYEQRHAASGQALWLERQVALLESIEALDRAIAAQQRLITEHGHEPGQQLARTLRLARLQLAADQGEAAYASLRALLQPLPPEDTEYWQLLTDLAWDLQDEPVALAGLERQTGDGVYTPEQADRLLLLLRSRDPARAARLAESAWARHGEAHDGLPARPDYLRLAIEIHWERQALDELDRLFASLSPAQEAALAGGDGDFWRQRALWQAARGRREAALEDLRRAIAARPDEPELHSMRLFLLIEAGRPAALQQALDELLARGTPDERLDPAIAAALEVLGQPGRALPYWRRQAAARLDDAAWLFAYADLLEAAGRPQTALHARRRALELLQARQRAGGAAPTRLELLQLARLALRHAPGDANARLWQRIDQPDPRPAPPDASAQREAAQNAAALDALRLTWWLDRGEDEPARHWLAAHPQRRRALPDWARVAAAVRAPDPDELEALLARAAPALPPRSRIEALAALGRQALAHDERLAEIARHEPAEDELVDLHAEVVEQAWARGRSLSLDLRQQRQGLRVETRRLRLAGPVGAADRLGLTLSRQRIGVLRADVWGELPDGSEGLGLDWQHALDPMLDVELGLQRHGAWAPTWGRSLGLSARPDAALDLRLDLGLDEPADESEALALAGRRDRLRLGSDWRLAPTLQLGLAGQLSRYALQGGPALGRGRSLDATLTHWLRLARPDLALGLALQQRSGRTAAVTLPAATAGLVAGGVLPGADFFVPGDERVWSLALSSGLSLQQRYVRAWQPFAELRASRSDRSGSDLGAQLGLAGSLLGGDQLVLWLRRGRLVNAADGVEQSAGLRYELRL